jgi:hypothetical protein
MNEKLRYAPALACIALAILFALLQQGLLMALFLVLGLVVLAFSTLKNKREMQAQDVLDGLSNDSRVKLKPLLKLKDRIEDLVNAREPTLAAKVIGPEALAEANSLVEHVRRLLSIQDSSREWIHRSHEAKNALTALELQVEKAATDSERAMLLSAVAAKKAEIEQYRKMEVLLVNMDAKIKQAEASLSEMQARLVSGALLEGGDSKDELDQIVNRMRTLSTSFQQAENDLLHQNLQ